MAWVSYRIENKKGWQSQPFLPKQSIHYNQVTT